MFRKQFRVKHQVQIKTTERKTLRHCILRQYGTFTEEEIDNLFPKKEMIIVSHILTHDNKNVLVYSVNKRALFFNYEKVFYPTLVLLWQNPTIAITFMTNSFVVGKLLNGAHLMLPGIVNSPWANQLYDLGEICYVNSLSNLAAVAVGITSMSSGQMFMGASGKAVHILHSHGDYLCTLENMPLLPLPQKGSVEVPNLNRENFPMLGASASPPHEEPGASNVIEIIEEMENICIEVEDPTKKMDELLERLFFSALKYSKTLELPILTSNFYKLQMLENLAEGEVADIKKSSFKKLGQFLKYWHEEGVIVVKEKKKGIETIEAINKDHPLYVLFYMDKEQRPKGKDEKITTSTYEIIESFSITTPAMPLFGQFGFKKGDVIQGSDIRKHLTTYVKQQNLQNINNPKLIQVDDVLKKFAKNRAIITWEELIENIIEKLSSCYKIKSSLEEKLGKGKIDPIKMHIQSRAGNKKVTIVENLPVYNIHLIEFAKECQHAVAASTSIMKNSDKKHEQLLIQGNQILYLYQLLTEKYKIPKRYIKGLEFAPKKK